MSQGTSFNIESAFQPAGDQPIAIRQLSEALQTDAKEVSLLGVTGSGKTFTIANVIKELQRPALIIAHNKTLAAQLTQEFRTFFPHNAVEYFVSYYDYYQPEAYLPTTDTYIEKEADINQEIDRLRHAATSALMSRRDVIVVASVSAIYGLGSPREYEQTILTVSVGQTLPRQDCLNRLIDMFYVRSQTYERGSVAVRGSIIELVPPGKEVVVRIRFNDDTIEEIVTLDLVTRSPLEQHKYLSIFPAKHFVVAPDRLKRALGTIEQELADQLSTLRSSGNDIAADRLERRTKFDMAMLREIGYCNGIENYSRHLAERIPGSPPETLLDYFPDDFITIIDESHVTLPQIQGMFAGDRARKDTLIEYGFRLPSARDNRPLTFEEFMERTGQKIYLSATPGQFETRRSAQVVEQIIRPTGLIDPAVEIRPVTSQVENAIEEIKKEIELGERVLVTTLTKKMAEDLTEFLTKEGLKAKYLHSDVDTLDRIRTLDSLRRGETSVLVGVNLLREGLDLPEVSLVVILDADKEGFLRSETSLVQTIGRAARNVRGRVILYADSVTASMDRAMKETERRRQRQMEYNATHGITPHSVKKELGSILPTETLVPELARTLNPDDLPRQIRAKESQMKQLAKDLNFEEAALVRDELIELRKLARTFKLATR